jgi:hypothetical protein
MMIDDDTLKQLLRINDELMRLCKWLNERRDLETSSRLIPLVKHFLALTAVKVEALPEPEMKWEAPFLAVNKSVITMVRAIKE